jgi:rhodanese-related sulfurtransferase
VMIQEIDASTLENRIDAGDDFLLLDIRSAGELAQGVLPNAVHIPMHLIPLRLSELPKDKDVIIYCHSGARSYHACAYLAQQGYTNAVNLRGGILAWARSGYRLETRMAS